MNLKLLISVCTISCYAAQGPIPKIAIRPLPSTPTPMTNPILAPELLDQFKSLIDSMGASTAPQVDEIKKELNTLYQQIIQRKIYLTSFNTQLKALVNKMTQNDQYKDQKFFNTAFDQQITLAEFGQTFKELLKRVDDSISLLAITPQKINYLREIIDALPSGKGVPEKLNNARFELIKLLEKVRNRSISLDELVANLYGIKEMFETQPSIKDTEFKSPKYGNVKLKEFSEIVIGDLVDQISKREIPKLVPTPAIVKQAPKPVAPKGIFSELEEPEFIEKPSRPLPPTPSIPPVLPPKAVTSHPHGLSNIGNNCFMNASLQALYTLTDLNNQLLLLADKYKPDTFGAEYINLINIMRDPSTGVIEPKAVCHRGWAKMGFNPLTQQDNDEFINVLLDELLGNPLDPDNPIIPQRKLLEIQLQTFLAGKPQDLEPSTVLLSLPANCPNLEACLKVFFGIEKVERGYPAKPGGPLPQVDKQEKIVSLGKYLIIHLKRNIRKIDPKTGKPVFKGREMLMDKLTHAIPFPISNLDLNAYALPGVTLPLYRLNAIVIHAGSAKGGHYTGYVRYGNQWYFVNDSQVAPVSQQQIEQIAKQGYGSAPDQTPTTLFYERM